MQFSQLAIGTVFTFGIGTDYELVVKTGTAGYRLLNPANRINELWRGDVENLNQSVFVASADKQIIPNRA